MRNVLKSKFLWASAFILSLGIAGCNIFNPTESINIKDDDADALTYEGYKRIRDNEYTEAEYYFSKAIAADSNNSKAWFGLMKSTLNRKLNSNGDDSTNLFKLLSYVNASRESKAPFVGMSDNVANKLQEAIDTVNAIADIFIERDKSGKTDSLVTYKTISEGYLVLQMMKTMLILRKTTAGMQGCSLAKNQENSCDVAAVLNNLKDDPAETVESFHAVFTTCEESPESMTKMFSSYLPSFDQLKDEAQKSAVGSMCGALAKETEDAAGNEDEEAKTLNIIIAQFSYSDITDDDGDGCVDEELYDGEDNDGDGEIDEDVSDKTVEIKYNDDLILKNITAGKTAIKDLRVVKSAAPNDKYKLIDIDMNGKTVGKADAYGNIISVDQDEQNREWGFVWPEYNQRITASYHNEAKDSTSVGDHRLNFAKDLHFNPSGYPYQEYLVYKKAVAKDTKYPPVYDLTYRKQVIGGCWKYYNEESFKKWFEGRNN